MMKKILSSSSINKNMIKKIARGFSSSEIDIFNGIKKQMDFDNENIKEPKHDYAKGNYCIIIYKLSKKLYTVQ